MDMTYNAGSRFAQEDSTYLEHYFESQAVVPERYTGQLTPTFQRRLGIWHQQVTEADCDFYHTLALPGGRVIPGAWDLRGSEARYLGFQDFANKRVLEVGPATGWLTSSLARQGADVVVFDLPFGTGPEIMPFQGIDPEAHRQSGTKSVDRLRNSWWYAKGHLNFQAQAVYGDIYHPPSDMGRFDAAVFGAILLHLSNPFRALQAMAAMVDDTIVVTDVFSAPEAVGSGQFSKDAPPIALFNATPPPNGLVHWWSLGPSVIARMLDRLGFADITIDCFNIEGMESRPPMFTVVGHRKPRAAQTDGSARLQPPAPQAKTEHDASADLPVPSGHERFMVSGTEDLEVFLNLGIAGFNALTGSLRKAGVKVEHCGRVLDFGCGVGRVLRYWAKYPAVQVHGTDFQEELLSWCRKNLSFGRFALNTLEPALSYPDGHFNVIYALSVFTHLPEAMQADWFGELMRCLKPGGMLYFTTHGDHYRYLLNSKDAADFDAGRLVELGIDRPGTNICTIFHPRSWLKAHFFEEYGTELVEFIPCGARGNPEQDSYLVRKPL